MDSVNTLVKSLSIDNLMNQRERVAELIRRAHGLLLEAETLAESAHLGSVEDILNPRRRRCINFLCEDGAANALHDLDGAGWAYLMQESGLRTFMDAKARAEWDKSVNEGTYPPLTYDHIKATFAGLFSSRGEMFERGVIEIFKSLSWDYKTNQPFKFGTRIILHHFSSGYIYSNGLDKLDDLWRVCCVLDGKPQPDSRDGVGATIRALHIHQKANRWHGEYFSVKWFKKGTAHVAFARPDLVQQLNAILARHYPRALASMSEREESD